MNWAAEPDLDRFRRARAVQKINPRQGLSDLEGLAALGSVISMIHMGYATDAGKGVQTLTEIGAEQNSTIVFPMPIDNMKPFLDILEKADKGANGAARGPLTDSPLLNA